MPMTSATGVTRRHPGLWWLLGVLAATLVFPGLGTVVALVAAWRLPQRRVAFIVLAVALIVWTLLFTPWSARIEHGSSVQHRSSNRTFPSPSPGPSRTTCQSGGGFTCQL